MKDNSIELPPLPDGYRPSIAKAMRDYARTAIKADRKHHDRMLAHEWIRPALGLSEDAPYRFYFYAQEIEKLVGGEPVPKGWKLVPEMPTSKQIVHMALQIKGADADGWFRTDGDDWHQHVAAAERAYKWALSEAPQPAEPAKADAVCQECGGDGAGGEHEDDCSQGEPVLDRANLVTDALSASQPADPSGASTLHNADSGAQNGIQATQPAEPIAMSLDDAIAHAVAIAADGSTPCQRQHLQLAAWLRELREFRCASQQPAESVLYTSQKALDLASRSDAVINVGLTRVPQMSWNVPLYTAPQPAEPVTPRTHFEDARVQKVYEIICGDNHPPYGEHWDGYVSRLIVDALFPAEPVKPCLIVKYDEKGDSLYICCDSSEPADAEENEQGVLLWRAYSDGRLVGVTIPNFLGPMSNR